MTNIDDLIRQLNRLQRQVDSLVKPEVGRFIDWTPTVTQNVAVAVTVEYAWYIIENKRATVQARLTITGAGTSGNAIVIGGQPTVITPYAGGEASVLGSVIVYDSGTARYQGSMIATWRMYAHNHPAAIGVSPTFGLVAGDVIGFSLTYRVS